MSEVNRRVLILGAGMVSAPVVEYLYRDREISINVCSHLKDESDRLASRYPGVKSTYLNVSESPGHLASLCSENDVVISLLPYALHGLVAEHCIQAGTHMVTASYITEHVRSLHDRAQKSGVTILNEVGLDPGIDHLLALECIQDIQKRGGAIESFISYCGGLPAPEHSNNPLRYKFSWSPRGALLNTLSAAKYVSEGEIVRIPSGGAIMSNRKDLDFLPEFALEGLPNRDSTQYGELYGLGSQAKTILRGTIRFRGFSECIQALQLVGLIDTEPHRLLHPDGPDITWRQLVANLLGVTDLSISYEDLKQILSGRTGTSIDGIEGLGLLDDVPVVRLVNPLDTISGYLSKRLAFGENERDLVILRHEIIVKWNDNTREEMGINFVTYGKPASEGGHSAMALTVGFPAAIAAKMVLDGEIQQRGVILPFAPHVYQTMLMRLRSEGLHSTETTRVLE